VLGEHGVAVHRGDGEVDADGGEVGLVHLQGERARLVPLIDGDLDVEPIGITGLGKERLRLLQIEGVLGSRRGVANHRRGDTVHLLATAPDARDGRVVVQGVGQRLT
jgi:hypothetical protein